MENDYNFTAQEIEDGKAMAGVAYLTLIGFIVALIVGKDNRFTMYHVQQALALFIVMFAAGIIAVIPVLGQIVMVITWIFGIVCLIMGLINGFGGQAKPLPIIGALGFKFNMVKSAPATTNGGNVPPPPPPPAEG